MEPPRENSPSTPSRYLNSYLQQNSTELFHQNFAQRQLPTQQFYAADNLSTNNKNYLKRHHQNYHDKNNDSDHQREKNNKKLDETSLHHNQQSYDGFNSDSYSAAAVTSAGTTAAVVPTAAAAATTTPNAKGAAANTKSLSNGKKTKGRVKIKMEYIDNKLRRYTTFSKRKTGIMKKVSESFA